MLLTVLLVASSTAIAPVIADGLTAEDVVRVERAVHRAAETALAPVVNESTAQKRLDAAHVVCDVIATDCLVQIAVVVDAERIVAARATRTRLEVRLLDVATAKVSARASVPLDVARPEDGANAALAALSKPDAVKTHLVVHTTPLADVLVDAVAAGKGPSVELTKLAAGQHTVVARMQGRADVKKSVDVVLGEPTVVEAPLTGPAPLAEEHVAPSPVTPASSAAVSTSSTPYVVAGVGGVVLLVGAGVLVADALVWNQINVDATKLNDDERALEKGEPVSDDIGARRKSYDAAVPLWTTLTVAGAAIVSAGAGAAIAGVVLGVVE